jgi:hypothetical protein
MEQKNTTIFLDAIGRTIIGEVSTEDTTEQLLGVKNPAVVSIMPNTQTGQTLQILPLFFKEFQAEKSESTVWFYNKANITVSKDVALDFRFLAQYNQIFNKTVVEQPATQSPEQPAVIRLFDEE